MESVPPILEPEMAIHPYNKFLRGWKSKILLTIGVNHFSVYLFAAYYI